MLTKIPYAIADIQVPAKRIKTLEPAKVEEIANSILEEGQKTPIQIRAAGGQVCTGRRVSPAGSVARAWRRNRGWLSGQGATALTSARKNPPLVQQPILA